MSVGASTSGVPLAVYRKCLANLRLTVERAPYGRSPDRFFSFFSKFFRFVIKKGLEKNVENIFEEIEKISRGILEREKFQEKF